MMIISLFGSLGILSLLPLIFILAKLSARFGSVVKMAAIYRFYYLALFFVAIGALTHLVVAGANLEPQKAPGFITSPDFLFFTYHLPLAIGVTIAIIITWLYWSWLITEYNK